MEDTINHLAFLHLELPDPDLELSFQAPSTFTCFPQLPTELRLKIWRFTFPKSTCFWEQRIRFYKSALCIPQPPISASINYESREETLKHYALFEMAETKLYERYNGCYRRFRRRRSNIHRDANNQRTRTIYWNSKRNTMISRFQSKSKTNFDQIWPVTTSVRKLQLLVPWWKTNTAALIMRSEFEGNGLYGFPELLELQLIRARMYPVVASTEEERPNENNVQECFDCFAWFFERRLARGEIRQIPEITAWRWNRVHWLRADTPAACAEELEATT
jgi:hypothetical protein